MWALGEVKFQVRKATRRHGLAVIFAAAKSTAAAKSNAAAKIVAAAKANSKTKKEKCCRVHGS